MDCICFTFVNFRYIFANTAPRLKSLENIPRCPDQSSIRVIDKLPSHLRSLKQVCHHSGFVTDFMIMEVMWNSFAPLFLGPCPSLPQDE